MKNTLLKVNDKYITQIIGLKKNGTRNGCQKGRRHNEVSSCMLSRKYYSDI